MQSENRLVVRWLGRIRYAEALALQESLVCARRSGAVEDTLLLLEHPPVITVGRGGRPEHLLVTPAELARRGVEIHDAGRGGDVTYHGPGQLVGYPILALRPGRRDAHAYLRELEEVLIRAVGEFGLLAGRESGLTGVWVGGNKVGAIGVRLSTGWISSHGFALNVNNDLSGFAQIVPCGISDRGVTSLARMLGRELDLKRVAAVVAEQFAGLFGLQPLPAERPDQRIDVREIAPERPQDDGPCGNTPEPVS